MSPETIGIIGLCLLLAGIFMRMPIAWVMGFLGIVGTILLRGFAPGVSLAATVPFSSSASYILCTIPMFILMGNFLFRSGLSGLLYRGVDVLIGSARGGVAIVTLIASAFLAAVTGSSVANAATMGTLAWPEMKKLGYNPSIGAGVIAAGGTLGILIPPSTGFILYGLLTEQSIGRLFIAGVFPGLIMAAIMILVVIILVTFKPSIAPLKTTASNMTWREKWLASAGILPMFVIFLIIIGGIYRGIFTPTEAGALGALLSFICLAATRNMSKAVLWECLTSTVRTTCMIFAIIIGTMIFGYFLALTRLPMQMADYASTLNVPPLVILILVLLVFAVLGCFIDVVALTLLAVPIVFPVVQALGFDLIWFGVLCIIMGQIGLLTPPVGMNCYVLAGVMPEVPLMTIFRGIWPMLIAMVITLALVIAFPGIATWLPQTMMGK